MTEQNKLKVYYDGLCMVCHHEMEIYKKKDKNKKIDFIDITAQGFDAESEGLDPEAIEKVMHVKDRNSNIVTGVDSFVAIWNELGVMQPVAKISRSKFGKPLFDLGYNSFARVRKYLPKRKCESERCNIK